MIDLTLEITIPPEILGLAAKLGDISPVLRDFQQYRRETFENQIGAEIAPDGGTIAPLSDRYRQWKERKYPGQPIRKLTGATVNSYRSYIAGNSLYEELKSPHVNYVQRGGRAPARPYFPEELTERDRAALERLAWQFVLRSMNS